MKKIGITLLTALVGGAMAIGGYKLIEGEQTSTTIEDKQKVYFANNPISISSAGEVDFVQAAAAVTPAVVHIQTTYSGSQRSQGSGDPFEEMFRDFFGSPRGNQQRQPAMASGSGVIVSDDGYIVTNNHVVENANKIEVILPDKRAFQAKVIGRDPNTDLALIKVNSKGLPVVKLGNSDNVQVGEWVLAVGYPLTLQTTVTAGIVSAKGRALGLLGQPSPEEMYNRRGDGQPRANAAIESFIQTDAAINRGNSGGALVNTKGELIGINAAIASQTGYYAGYGFAIPVNLAKKIMDDFIKYGAVKRGFIGVTFRELDANVAKEYGVKQINGLYVNEVIAGGAGQAAGIRKGDIISKIEGRTILSSSDLQEKVGRMRPGEKVKLGIVRDGKEQTITVTLKGEEQLKSAGSSRSSEEMYNALGASFTPLSGAQKSKYNIASGVVVTDVRRGGVFYEYGITRGTVITHMNGKPVNNTDDIDKALSASKNNVLRLNGIASDGSRITMTFPLVQ